MSMKRLVPALLCLALLAACGDSVAGKRDSLRAEPSPSYSPVSTAEACPPQTPEHLPADAGTISRAYVCTEEHRRVPGDGEWLFSVVQGVSSGLDALLAAYSAKDQEPGGGICSLELPSPLAVSLHGERVMSVRAPLDPCHKPSRDGRAAYQQLGLTEVSAAKVRRITSELSITSGCSERYKDMLSLDSQPPSLASTGAPKPIASGQRTCFYDVAADREADRVGELRSVGTIAPDAQAAINRELAKSTADATCSRSEHTRFVLITESPGSPATLIALDGCAVQQDRGWWRATDRLRELVGPH